MSKIMAKQMTPTQWAVQHKDSILKEFSPAFCFHKNEYIFPTDIYSYAQNVLKAKMKHYENKTLTELTEGEAAEYSLIKAHFFSGGDSGAEFNINGFGIEEVKTYLKVEIDAKDDLSKPKHTVDELLTFNEQKLGYKLGSQVPMEGCLPDKNNEVNCPVYVSYVPTSKGAVIRYECFYAVSGAIYGTDMLYEILPEKISEKAQNFAVHAGDWEGVFIEVIIDNNGKATLDHMQTFAHGRDGARKIPAKWLDFKDTHPCVYVGCSTHPSYTDNFWCRNKFVDIVGDKYTTKSIEFVDLSPDVLKPVWANCTRWGVSSLMTASNAVSSEEEYRASQAPDNWLKYAYHPISETWTKVKQALCCCKPKAKISPALDLEEFEVEKLKQVNNNNVESSSGTNSGFYDNEAIAINMSGQHESYSQLCEP